MSKQSTAIDLARAAKALQELDQIAIQHPELLATSFEQSNLQDQWESYLETEHSTSRKDTDLQSKRGSKAAGSIG